MATIDPEALSPEKRSQILHGAAVVFAQDGYEGASMSRIAKEANVSKGTLYNYFEGKAELFGAHLRQACDIYLGQVFEQLRDDEELEVTLHQIGRRMLELMLTPERRNIYRMVISEAGSFPDLARIFYEAGPKRSQATLANWIAAQVARGRLDVPDTQFAAEQFFALCQTKLSYTYRLHLRGEPSEAEIAQVVDGAVRMFLACYGPRP